jgi:hypothetical protein
MDTAEMQTTKKKQREIGGEYKSRTGDSKQQRRRGKR